MINYVIIKLFVFKLEFKTLNYSNIKQIQMHLRIYAIAKNTIKFM